MASTGERSLNPTIPCLTAAFLALVVAPAGAQERGDSAAVRSVVREYADGFGAGDVDRVRRAVHPGMARRSVFSDPGRQSVLADMDVADLLEITLQRGGSATPPRDRAREIVVLDLYRNAAAAKLVTADGVEYLHLARWEGRWVVLDILWELDPGLRRPDRVDEHANGGSADDITQPREEG